MSQTRQIASDVLHYLDERLDAVDAPMLLDGVDILISLIAAVAVGHAVGNNIRGAWEDEFVKYVSSTLAMHIDTAKRGVTEMEIQ